jgi:hypothetical protein
LVARVPISDIYASCPKGFWKLAGGASHRVLAIHENSPGGAEHHLIDIVHRIARHFVEAAIYTPLEMSLSGDVPPAVGCKHEYFLIAKGLP